MLLDVFYLNLVRPGIVSILPMSVWFVLNHRLYKGSFFSLNWGEQLFLRQENLLEEEPFRIL